MNLLIATVITIVGVSVLLFISKPSQEEKKAFDELEKAWNELIKEVGQALKIDKFLDWLTRKLER